MLVSAARSAAETSLLRMLQDLRYALLALVEEMLSLKALSNGLQLQVELT
jgi:hypothetical protein